MKLKKLNIGCGPFHHLKDFDNLDIRKPADIIVKTAKDLSKIPTGSYDLVRSSNLLEHFLYTEVKDVLIEWLRVLKRRGVMEIIVPDFDALIDLYHKHRRSIRLSRIDSHYYSQQFFYGIFGVPNGEAWQHRCAFNKPLLRELMCDVGLEKIRSFDPWASEAGFYLQNEYMLESSLRPFMLALRGVKK